MGKEAFQRYDWVDYSKTIGITLVVYGHVARGLYNAGIELPEKLYLLADAIIYSFHMPLFFFLSGLFFYKSFVKHGAVGLIKSKIDTIVYPYILWSIIQGSIEVFFSDYTNNDVTYIEVFSLLWNPRAQFWFFYALFLCFILSTTTYLFLPERATIGIFILSSILYLCPNILPYTVMTFLISRYYVFFMMGIIFSIYVKTKELSKPYTLFILTLLFVCSQYIFHVVFDFDYGDRGLSTMLLSLASIMCIVSMSLWLSKSPNRIILVIGRSSLAIYILHILIGSGTRIILKSFIGLEFYVYHIICGCLFGLSLPTIIYIFLKKLNFPYLFYAPIGSLGTKYYYKMLQRNRKI